MARGGRVQCLWLLWRQAGRWDRRKACLTLGVGLLVTLVVSLLASQRWWEQDAADGRRPQVVALREADQEVPSWPYMSVELVPPKNTYECFSDVDVDGYDYGHVRKHTMEELQRVCDATPHCAGFNTNGWLKTSTAARVPGAANLCVKQHVGEWKTLTSSPRSPSQRQHQHQHRHRQQQIQWHQEREPEQGKGLHTREREGISTTGEERKQRAGMLRVEASVGDVLARMLVGRMRLFTYPLPEHLRLPPIEDYKYAAEARFVELLQGSAYNTDVGEEADAFFVRIACAEARFTVRDRAAGQEAADAHALAVLSHIIQTYPYWNRTLGHDHFFVCGHDMGAAPRTAAARAIPAARNMVALVNTADVAEPDYNVHKDIALPPHVGDGCPTCIQGGLDMLQALRDKVAGIQEREDRENARRGEGEEREEGRDRGRGGAGRRQTAGGSLRSTAEAAWAGPSTPEDASQYAGTERPLLGFVAGNMARGRVRPVLHSALARDTDVVVVDGYMGQREYVRHLLRSKYCLLPRGHRAWSPRIMDAVWAGCVPVLISDHYDIPLQRWVDWHVLALQIPEAEAHNAKAWLEADAHSMYARRIAYLINVQHRLTWQHHTLPRQEKHFHMRTHQPSHRLLDATSPPSAFDLLLLELSLRFSQFPTA